MKSSWPVRTLSEVCQIRPPKSEARHALKDDDLVSFVPMNDLPIRAKRLNSNSERPLGKVYGGYTYFSEGDVLLAKITPCFENGKLGIARGLKNGIGFGSSEFFVLRPDESVDPEFLFYFLCQDSVRDSGKRVMSGAVGHKRVPKEIIEQLSVPGPPLEEQKLIVAILDEAFAGIETAIANTEKNLANARELFESCLSAAFIRLAAGFPEVDVEKVCISIIDCINKTAPQVDDPTPFKMLRTTNVRNGVVNSSTVKFVSEETYKKWTRRQVPMKGDLLLTREAPLGEVGLLETNDKVFLGQRLVAYRPDPKIVTNRFLLFSFRSQYVQSQIAGLASGSTVQHMRVPDSKRLRLIIVDPNI